MPTPSLITSSICATDNDEPDTSEILSSDDKKPLVYPCSMRKIRIDVSLHKTPSTPCKITYALCYALPTPFSSASLCKSQLTCSVVLCDVMGWDGMGCFSGRWIAVNASSKFQKNELLIASEVIVTKVPSIVTYRVAYKKGPAHCSPSLCSLLCVMCH